MVLEAIKYSPQDATLLVLDQLQLPYQTHYDPVRNCEEAHAAIKSMRVRGAPAIAMVAVLGLAVDLKNRARSRCTGSLKDFIPERLDYLITSRPTAVNLADAAGKLKAAIRSADTHSDQYLIDFYVQKVEEMLREDVLTNKAIGKCGATWITSNTRAGTNGPVGILTHCNTGSLATAGYGTALGVIRALHETKSLRRAYCTETRPYNQGSRLTAFELVHDEIPATLITDSMASALLQLKGDSENIAAIVVGADRVAANGDTANKIGTYALAITAKYHGVKFLVAAPRTTIDMGTPTGREITIEERAAKEMTTIRGPAVHESGVDRNGPSQTVSIAAEGIEVWNPAFDVTPSDLIDGIVTEVGVAEKDVAGQFNLAEIMEVESLLHTHANGAKR